LFSTTEAVFLVARRFTLGTVHGSTGDLTLSF
jgi:hypothetical protein